MTIEEAIEHAMETAWRLGCTECAEDHKRLAAWLWELKMWREHPFKMLLLRLWR